MPGSCNAVTDIDRWRSLPQYPTPRGGRQSRTLATIKAQSHDQNIPIPYDGTMRPAGQGAPEITVTPEGG